jgi:hypothetical protein
VLRSVAAPVIALVAVVVGAIQCGPDWAVNPNQSPRPVPSITAEQATATRALLIDALLDQSDLPDGVAVSFYEKANLEPDDYMGFIGTNGWMVIATTWSSGTDSAVFGLDDYRYGFADASSARQYMDSHRHADPLRTQAPELVGFAPDTYAFADTITVSSVSNPERRGVQIRSVLGRFIISLRLTMPAERTDWREYALTLLGTARQRTQEAIASAGE